jgi:hypothetical protein
MDTLTFCTPVGYVNMACALPGQSLLLLLPLLLHLRLDEQVTRVQ